MFVLLSNLIGLIPYSFTLTSHLIVTFALALMVFTSCSLTRNVENGEFLLNKVKVNVSDPNLNSDLNGLIKQKENRKILWIYRFKLRFYI